MSPDKPSGRYEKPQFKQYFGRAHCSFGRREELSLCNFVTRAEPNRVSCVQHSANAANACAFLQTIRGNFMTDNSASLHESAEQLKPETIDRHRAVASIMEELEAIDWYDQRIDAASDPELKEILAHNRDEEKEHAAMTLEWLRRHDAKLDEHLRTYLFTSERILDIEDAAEHSGERANPNEGSLGIGSLRAQPQARP